MTPRQETRLSKTVKALEAVVLERNGNDLEKAYHDMAMLAVQRQKEERQTRAYAEELRRKMIEVVAS